MEILNQKQIQFLEDLLQEQGISYAPLQEEMLDHICCAIEEELAAGHTFDTATQRVLAIFGQNGLAKIQTATIQTLFQKKFTMKKVSLLVLCTMLLMVTLVQGNTQDPPTIAPLEGMVHITSSFGQRLHPILKVKKMHKGTDFKVPMGTPIVATADGEVLSVTNDPKGYGKRIILQHDDIYKTCYAQLSVFKIKKGDQVKKGQVIALSGNSGASTAPHLHYEVLKNGESVDPEAYFSYREMR